MTRGTYGCLSGIGQASFFILVGTLPGVRLSNANPEPMAIRDEVDLGTDRRQADSSLLILKSFAKHYSATTQDPARLSKKGARHDGNLRPPGTLSCLPAPAYFALCKMPFR